VRVVAPGSPFDRTLVLRGMGWLAERYRVEFDAGIFCRDGFLAGSDERRLRELNAALKDPEVAAVVAARGGYGTGRIWTLADFGALRGAPKWLVGFSDITLLHLEAARVGIASLHAHNVAGLGRADARARQRWLDALEDPFRLRRYTGLACWQPGRAQGVLFGGNLTLLFSAAASGRLHVPDGAVLALEDVTESSYRIDRMLTALRDAGVFDGVSAVLLGEFSDCLPGKHGVPVDQVLFERLSELRIPVLSGLAFGHGRWNEPLPFGLPAAVDAHAGVLSVGDLSP
jgi:muramoyltetrapeptide carboxypeptidase